MKIKLHKSKHQQCLVLSRQDEKGTNLDFTKDRSMLHVSNTNNKVLNTGWQEMDVKKILFVQRIIFASKIYITVDAGVGKTYFCKRNIYVYCGDRKVISNMI